MVAGSVAALVQEAIKLMRVGRIMRAAALIGVGLGAAAIATPVFVPDVPARLGGRPTLIDSVAPGRSRLARTAQSVDRHGDPLPRAL